MPPVGGRESLYACRLGGKGAPLFPQGSPVLPDGQTLVGIHSIRLRAITCLPLHSALLAPPTFAPASPPRCLRIAFSTSPSPHRLIHIALSTSPYPHRLIHIALSTSPYPHRLIHIALSTSTPHRRRPAHHRAPRNSLISELASPRTAPRLSGPTRGLGSTVALIYRIDLSH
jgi:hypothetical protein